jgi:hypothetical protein
MFEIAIFCIVVIAVAYSAFLWRMGRRADVLHGQFIRNVDAPLRSLLQILERDRGESRN